LNAVNAGAEMTLALQEATMTRVVSSTCSAHALVIFLLSHVELAGAIKNSN